MAKDKTVDPGNLAKAIAAFDLDDPELPDAIDDAALTEDGYPFDKKLRRKDYEKAVEPLQVELVKLQAYVKAEGLRLVLVFEGRDAAGKGGTIGAFREHMNPRQARAVALDKPTERERGEWYFQRYVPHLPTRGEIVFFDRSWYNRGVVEPVNGFCTEEEATRFLFDAPHFERMLVGSGTLLWKFWLNISQATQLKRFHERRHDPLKRWKLSPLDYEAIGKFDAYTHARDRMLSATHTPHAPWTVVRAHDQKRARIECIRRVLSDMDYPDKDKKTIGECDERLIGRGPDFLTAYERP